MDVDDILIAYYSWKMDHPRAARVQMEDGAMRGHFDICRFNYSLWRPKFPQQGAFSSRFVEIDGFSYEEIEASVLLRL